MKKSATKRRRSILIVFLVGLLVLLLLLPILRARSRTQWAIAVDSADAGFYKTGWVEEPKTASEPRYVSEVYVIGVLKIYSRTREDPPHSISVMTNTVPK